MKFRSVHEASGRLTSERRLSAGLVCADPGVGVERSSTEPRVQRVDVVGTSERDRLQYFLDQQRTAVLAIIDGLDESQLHTPVLPSGWTPIGLVRHLIGAEAMWFQWVVLGTQPQVVWDDGPEDAPDEPGAPFTTEHSSAAVIQQYRRQCEISNEVLRSQQLDAPLRGEHGLDWPGSRSPIFAGWRCT